MSRHLGILAQKPPRSQILAKGRRRVRSQVMNEGCAASHGEHVEGMIHSQLRARVPTWGQQANLIMSSMNNLLVGEMVLVVLQQLGQEWELGPLAEIEPVEESAILRWMEKPILFSCEPCWLCSKVVTAVSEPK